MVKVAGRVVGRVVLLVAMAAVVVAASSSSAWARQNIQKRGRAVPAPGPAVEAGVSPAEIQRLFDAYVVMQAQQELHLSDDQFPQFLGRVRALQDVRRRGQGERGRILQQLRRLSQDATVDDNELRSQLKALADLDGRSAEELHRATEAIDQVLTIRQQARFRLFEEMMERRKVDLLMRARQANRARP